MARIHGELVLLLFLSLSRSNPPIIFSAFVRACVCLRMCASVSAHCHMFAGLCSARTPAKSSCGCWRDPTMAAPRGPYWHCWMMQRPESHMNAFHSCLSLHVCCGALSHVPLHTDSMLLSRGCMQLTPVVDRSAVSTMHGHLAHKQWHLMIYCVYDLQWHSQCSWCC